LSEQAFAWSAAYRITLVRMIKKIGQP